MELTPGGFQKHSLIDFPGTIACVIFTQGCNFRCPYCHNPDLIPPPGRGSGKSTYLEEVFAFLKKRRGLLDGVVITGGEPTLQWGLDQFCLKIRKMGYKVKLDTNGSRPGVLENLLARKLVDYVAMDIKTHLALYPKLTGPNIDPALIRKSIELIMDQAPDYEFRTTCVRPFIDEKIMEDIGKLIHGANLYILQACTRDASMLDPEFSMDKKKFYSRDQLLELKKLVENQVQSSILR